jgi:CAAX protease family protein
VAQIPEKGRSSVVNPRIASGGRWKAILGPLGRILLATILVGGAVAVAQVTVKLLQGVLSLGGAVPAFYYLAYLVVSVLVAYFVYRAYVLGTLIGFGLIAITVVVLWVAGFYSVLGANGLAVIFVSLANDGAGAFVEEVILRGVFFRITEERLGTWVALAISVVLFALLHLASPGATVASTILVGIEGGILLSAAYVFTRRLWLAIGIHFGWDFSQDGLFGVGSGSEGVLRGELSGPGLLSGGNAGIEGSVIALVLCLAVSAYLLVGAKQKGNLMGPAWTRGGQSTVR